MSADVARPLFPLRDRRILLWVCVAAVCWRWLLAVRTPLPRVEAVHDLWAGAALAGGDFGVLREVWQGPWWSLLLAPAIAFGCEPFESAMVMACIAAGVAMIPIACAAQRLRAGAGVATALLLFTVPEPSLSAAGGSPVGLHMLWGGAALWGLVARRHLLTVVFAVLALADALRGGLWGLLPLGLLVVATAAGVGLAHLPVRLRDLVLTAAVGLMFFLSWRGVEPDSVVVERHLGEFVDERIPPSQSLVTELPRVAYFAGRRPQRVAVSELGQRLAAADVGAVVLKRPTARTLVEPLNRDYARFRLSPRFEDLASQHDVAVWFRRE